MIIWLFMTLTALSLCMIFIGLFRPQESVFAVIGFSFMFYLAIILMQGGIAYKVGENITTSYNYHTEENYSINSTIQLINDNYESFNDTNSAWFGRFLAMGSLAGFTAIFLGMGRRKEDDSE